MPAKPNFKFKVNTAGGRPAASSFLLSGQKKGTKENAAPVCRRCAVPCVARLVRRLRNSHDPLRVHVLKQSSPTPPDQPALLGGAQGRKSGNQKPKKRVGNKLPTILKSIGKTILLRYIGAFEINIIFL
jgi:hypothetical protein